MFTQLSARIIASLTLFFLLYAGPAQAQTCDQGNYLSATCLTTSMYPYTNGQGITVSATTGGGISTLSNFTYSCDGNTYNTCSQAWWLDNASEWITLTFSCPVTSLTVVVNGTNATEEFYFASNSGSISLSNYCNVGFTLTSPSSLLYSGASTAGTIITVNNPAGATQYTFTHNGLAAGSRISLLDCYVCTAVLPVEMGSFTAEYNAEENATELIWGTQSEVYFEGFAVEHSSDQQNWAEIGYVESLGEAGEGAAYDFRHDRPSAGTHYYRLRQLDLDGGLTYSEVRSIEVEGRIRDMRIYPNPSTGMLTIEAPTAQGVLTVADLYGRSILSLPFSDKALLDLSDQAPGVYFVRLRTEDGVMEERKWMLR